MMRHGLCRVSCHVHGRQTDMCLASFAVFGWMREVGGMGEQDALFGEAEDEKYKYM